LNTYDLAGSVDVIDVPVATLDSLLADRRQRVRFVKMDLEGDALQGATSILRDRPLVISRTAAKAPPICTAIRARIGSAFSTRRTSQCSICSAARSATTIGMRTDCLGISSPLHLQLSARKYPVAASPI
jgi:hypothetical protein